MIVECKYEEVKVPRLAPCSITSSSTDTFDECRELCSECAGFNFDYQTGRCELYNQESCIPDHKLNFFVVRCPRTDAVILQGRVEVYELYEVITLSGFDVGKKRKNMVFTFISRTLKCHWNFLFLYKCMINNKLVLK